MANSLNVNIRKGHMKLGRNSTIVSERSSMLRKLYTAREKPLKTTQLDETLKKSTPEELIKTVQHLPQTCNYCVIHGHHYEIAKKISEVLERDEKIPTEKSQPSPIPETDQELQQTKEGESLEFVQQIKGDTKHTNVTSHLIPIHASVLEAIENFTEDELKQYMEKVSAYRTAMKEELRKLKTEYSQLGFHEKSESIALDDSGMEETMPREISSQIDEISERLKFIKRRLKKYGLKTSTEETSKAEYLLTTKGTNCCDLPENTLHLHGYLNDLPVTLKLIKDEVCEEKEVVAVRTHALLESVPKITPSLTETVTSSESYIYVPSQGSLPSIGSTESSAQDHITSPSEDMERISKEDLIRDFPIIYEPKIIVETPPEPSRQHIPPPVLHKMVEAKREIVHKDKVDHPAKEFIDKQTAGKKENGVGKPLTDRSSIGIPYYVSYSSLPPSVQELICESDVTRNLLHDIEKKLQSLGLETLLLSSLPAPCARQFTINDPQDHILPYSASLHSLPLTTDDIEVIEKRASNHRKQSERSSANSHSSSNENHKVTSADPNNNLPWTVPEYTVGTVSEVAYKNVRHPQHRPEITQECGGTLENIFRTSNRTKLCSKIRALTKEKDPGCLHSSSWFPEKE